jgi:hypothetical protein
LCRCGWGRDVGGCVSGVVSVNIPSLCSEDERRETDSALNKAGGNYPHCETEDEGDFRIERKYHASHYFCIFYFVTFTFRFTISSHTVWVSTTLAGLRLNFDHNMHKVLIYSVIIWDYFKTRQKRLSGTVRDNSGCLFFSEK